MCGSVIHQHMCTTFALLLSPVIVYGLGKYVHMFWSWEGSRALGALNAKLERHHGVLARNEHEMLKFVSQKSGLSGGGTEG